MRFSTVISISLALTSALAIPVMPSEGVSNGLVARGGPKASRSTPTQALAKRGKQCNKGKKGSTQETETSGGTPVYDEDATTGDNPTYSGTPATPDYDSETSGTPTNQDITTSYSGVVTGESPSTSETTDYEIPESYASNPSSTARSDGTNRHRGGNNGSDKTSTKKSSGGYETPSPTPDGDDYETPSYDSPSPTPTPDGDDYETPSTGGDSNSTYSYVGSMPSGSSTGTEVGASVKNVQTDGDFMAESVIRDYLLAAHNIVRSLHENTGTVTWNSDIANFAVENTPTCEFKHTANRDFMGGLGENIAYNTNAAPEIQALRQWYANEVVNYNFNDPSSSSGVIGHMTAMVWKDVQQIGCAVRNCASKGMGLYLKCNYWPTPNIIGHYDEQVGRVKGASTTSEIAKVVEAATGFAPRGYESTSTDNGYT
ncbi:Latisemin [Dactylella cylindrospora]|nr:Latisemin [Dactylella cylindrospora]